jgi:hypothetical protein
VIAVLLWLLEILVLWCVVIPLAVRPLGTRIRFWSYPSAAELAPLGRWKYAVVKGALEWGLVFGLFRPTVDYIAFRFEHHPGSYHTVGFLFISLASSMLLGFLFGLAHWARRDRQLADSAN